MTSRTYRLQERLAAVEENRASILAAARSLITDSDSGAFTLEAVARKAGVTRSTLYNQFGSKQGLLEGVCDDVAIRGGIRDIDGILADADPVRALERYVAAFVELYEGDRLIFRRLFAMSALDGEFGEVLRDRADRKRYSLRILVRRIHEERHGTKPTRATVEAQALMLKALLSFDVFDTLLDGGATAARATRQLQALAVAALEPVREAASASRKPGADSSRDERPRGKARDRRDADDAPPR